MGNRRLILTLQKLKLPQLISADQGLKKNGLPSFKAKEPNSKWEKRKLWAEAANKYCLEAFDSNGPSRPTNLSPHKRLEEKKEKEKKKLES